MAAFNNKFAKAASGSPDSFMLNLNLHRPVERSMEGGLRKFAKRSLKPKRHKDN
ncbi:MAG: hypothetical protein IPH02_00440 [Sphingobacteriales bacterium]|nr:hypothetical protein [Sphingobacteriales bacterium]